MAEVQAFDTFTVEVARETWDTFRREPLLFLIAGLVVIGVSMVTLGILAGPIYVGFFELVRRVRNGEPVAVSVLFSRMDSFISSAVAGTIVLVLAMIGLVVLVVPGLLVIFFATWSPTIIAYERVGGVDSLRASYSLARAFPMHTLALVFAIWILHFLGSMLVVGALIVLPLATIALAIGYERLLAARPAAPAYARAGVR